MVVRSIHGTKTLLIRTALLSSIPLACEMSGEKAACIAPNILSQLPEFIANMIAMKSKDVLTSKTKLEQESGSVRLENWQALGIGNLDEMTVL